MSACVDRLPAGSGDGELVLRWRVVPIVGDRDGRIELQKAWDDGSWRTAGVFASRATARTLVEDRGGYSLRVGQPVL